MVENNQNIIWENKPSYEKELSYKNRLFWLPTLYEIIVFILSFFGLSFIAFTLMILIRVFVPDYSSYIMIANFLSYLILFIVFSIMIFTVKKGKELLNYFKDGKQYLFGLIMGAILIAGTLILGNIFSLIFKSTPNDNQQAITDMTFSMPIVTFIMTVILAPITEEIAYRAGLFTALSRKNRVLAYVITIFMFAIIHFSFDFNNIFNELINMPVYMLAAGILCFTYEKYGLGASIIAHMLNNLVSFLAIYIYK